MRKSANPYEQNFEIYSVEDYFNSSLVYYRKDYHIGEKIKTASKEQGIIRKLSVSGIGRD